MAFSHSVAQGNGVLMVTSAQPLEGKTTTACNLAVALAYGGAKVLLVDADMRRPSVHEAFGVPSEPGLAERADARHAPDTGRDAPAVAEPVDPARRARHLQPVGAAGVARDGGR